MLKRHILEIEGMDRENDQIFPSLSPAEITQKDTLLTEDKAYDAFFLETSLFSPLIPKYLGEKPSEEIHTLADMHNWIEAKPKGSIYPISKKMERLLKAHQLAAHRFYEAEVMYKNELIPYTVLQLDGNHYKNFINFNQSIFCKWDEIDQERLSDETYKLSDKTALDNFIDKNLWVGFDKAVMQAEFEHIDMMYIDGYGIMISPRLKEAIEAANLKGIAITSCPIEFDIAKAGELA